MEREPDCFASLFSSMVSTLAETELLRSSVMLSVPLMLALALLVLVPPQPGECGR